MYVDSNSEASDSDISDVAELDSDVEKEKQISYDRKLDSSDLNILKSEIKNELAAGQKRKEAPTDSLRLSFVHGFVTLRIKTIQPVCKHIALLCKCANTDFFQEQDCPS